MFRSLCTLSGAPDKAHYLEPFVIRSGRAESAAEGFDTGHCDGSSIAGLRITATDRSFGLGVRPHENAVGRNRLEASGHLLGPEPPDTSDDRALPLLGAPLRGSVSSARRRSRRVFDRGARQALLRGAGQGWRHFTPGGRARTCLRTRRNGPRVAGVATIAAEAAVHSPGP